MKCGYSQFKIIAPQERRFMEFCHTTVVHQLRRLNVKIRRYLMTSLGVRSNVFQIQNATI